MFGKSGLFFYEIARGRDQRPVEPVRVRKSIGAETTFPVDILEFATVTANLAELADEVAHHLQRKKASGRTLTLKVRYDDFTTITRSCTVPLGFAASADILAQVPRLLAMTEAGRRKIRLLGLSVSNLAGAEEDGTCHRQLPLPLPPGIATGLPFAGAWPQSPTQSNRRSHSNGG